MPKRSGAIIACEQNHKGGNENRDAADHHDRDRKPKPSRIWVLLEALAYGGAYIDPTGVLARQRFARIREAQRHGRRESSTGSRH